MYPTANTVEAYEEAGKLNPWSGLGLGFDALYTELVFLVLS